MQHKSRGIQTLLLRTFLPAVLLLAIALAILVYNLQFSVILDGFDRKLITTSALTGAMIDPEDHDWLLQEAKAGNDPNITELNERYIRNVEPMQRIRSKLGLTYLYTQALGGSGDIFYILDSSIGDEHSQIGSEDELPAETVKGLINAEEHATVFVSPIEYQKQWGLLKTSAAPVYGANGEITATAGADVNISVIQVATQNALFASAMIGIISILACLVVTLQIMRRIARPIETLKHEALRFAAGNHAPPAEIRRPREVARLRNALAEVTQGAVDTKEQNCQAAAQKRRIADEQHLILEVGARNELICLHRDHKKILLWIPTNRPGVVQAFAIRRMDLLRSRMSNDYELFKRWKELADLDHGACIDVDLVSGTLGVHGSCVTLRIDGKKQALSAGDQISISDTDSIRIPFETGDAEILTAEIS